MLNQRLAIAKVLENKSPTLLNTKLFRHPLKPEKPDQEPKARHLGRDIVYSLHEFGQDEIYAGSEMPGMKSREINRLRSLAAELFRPFRVSREILMADSRPGITNGFDKVLQDKRWFKELLGFHAEPGHLDSACVARRARGELLGSLVSHL